MFSALLNLKKWCLASRLSFWFRILFRFCHVPIFSSLLVSSLSHCCNVVLTSGRASLPHCNKRRTRLWTFSFCFVTVSFFPGRSLLCSSLHKNWVACVFSAASFSLFAYISHSVLLCLFFLIFSHFLFDCASCILILIICWFNCAFSLPNCVHRLDIYITSLWGWWSKWLSLLCWWLLRWVL